MGADGMEMDHVRKYWFGFKMNKTHMPKPIAARDPILNINQRPNDIAHDEQSARSTTIRSNSSANSIIS